MVPGFACASDEFGERLRGPTDAGQALKHHRHRDGRRSRIGSAGSLATMCGATDSDPTEASSV